VAEVARERVAVAGRPDLRVAAAAEREDDARRRELARAGRDDEARAVPRERAHRRAPDELDPRCRELALERVADLVGAVRDREDLPSRLDLRRDAERLDPLAQLARPAFAQRRAEEAAAVAPERLRDLGRVAVVREVAAVAAADQDLHAGARRLLEQQTRGRDRRRRARRARTRSRGEARRAGSQHEQVGGLAHFRFSSATVSRWRVRGNRSTGRIATHSNASCRSSRSRASVNGSHET
jgi:hypothetical protein